MKMWTLSGALWDTAVVIDGPRLDKEAVRVVELEPMLDLLERVHYRPRASVAEEAESEIEALLREHDRLGECE